MNRIEATMPFDIRDARAIQRLSLAKKALKIKFFLPISINGATEQDKEVRL